ncbi:MAG: transporter substrate-binding domain-containing protein [Albidovulum sp.]
MKKTMTFLGVSALALMIGGGAAMAQDACGNYVVKSGDSLRKIAKKAYGNERFQSIYNANRAIIGSNPNVIEIGMQLRLPCADGTTTEAAAPATSTDENAPIVLITGNDFPPFTDEQLPDRGMFTRLVEVSAMRSETEVPVEVKFVNDWDAHLETLLPAMAFDGSFPWSKPDCERPEILSKDDQNRCDNYNFSDPFYEIVDGLFARNGSGYETATGYEELKGTRICRPEGYSTGHLDAAGLTEPMITLTRPVLVSACFEALMAGAVDIVSIDSQGATDTMKPLGLQSEVSENPNLSEVQALYVVVNKSHPRAGETLDIVNRGLRVMQESGEWYDIVSTALGRQMAAKVN